MLGGGPRCAAVRRGGRVKHVAGALPQPRMARLSMSPLQGSTGMSDPIRWLTPPAKLCRPFGAEARELTAWPLELLRESGNPVHLIAEKSVGLAKTDSTLATILPLASDAF